MKSCLHETIIQGWLDGELAPQAAAAVQSHLAICPVCAERVRTAGEALALIGDAWKASLPENVPAARLWARIDDRLASQAPPAALFESRMAVVRWQFAAAIAILAIAVIGAFVSRLEQSVPPPPQIAPLQPVKELQPETNRTAGIAVIASRVEDAPVRRPPPRAVPAHRHRRDGRETWIEPDTNKHLGQTQLLLRSVRNAEPEVFSTLDYERELARELLTRNRLLRRRAEQKEDVRTERLLSHIEPLLLDIANLPVQPAPGEMQSLQQLIRKQQIIAELQLYAGNNGF